MTSDVFEDDISRLSNSLFDSTRNPIWIKNRISDSLCTFSGWYSHENIMLFLELSARIVYILVSLSCTFNSASYLFIIAVNRNDERM